MRKLLYHFGRYLILLSKLFVRFERRKVYWEDTMREAVNIGIGSLVIVFIGSLFIGAVMTLNTAYQLTSGLFPNSVIGSVVSAAALMEFAPTITALLLAGKVGSHIASEIGTMRVYEQLDALEVMGVNVPSYLILPKMLGGLIAFPCLVVISAFLIHLGGIMAGETADVLNAQEFANGVRMYYDEFQVTFMMIKSVVFGFIVTTISCYHGYFVKGGPREVGQASTRAVVTSAIAVFIADYILAALLL